MTFDLTLAAGGDSVNLNPTDTTNRTVISYVDVNYQINNLTTRRRSITGDTDNLLEAGELLEVEHRPHADGARINRSARTRPSRSR